MIGPNAHIGAMAPYALADLAPPSGKPLISLSQNESLRPPSPKVVEAVTNILADGALYPDPDWCALRAGLAAHHRVSADEILCGNGSLDLIGSLMRAYAGPGRSVLVPRHAYPFFKSAALMSNARVDAAEDVACVADVDNLLAAVLPDTAVVCLANPGNPTGTRLPRSEVLRLRDGLPDDVLLLLDEAYGEFADHLGERCFDLVERGNSIVLRTFSKAYGLASSRVGWGLFPRNVAAEVRKVMNPNNIAATSQAAACAAMADQSYMAETCAVTARLRDQARDRLQGLGLRVFPSFTNFLLIDFGAPARATHADHFLRSEGVFLRGQAGAGLPAALRMTIAAQDVMDVALQHLERWVEECPK